MSLANCQKCGKLFNRTRDRTCLTCREQEQEEFDLVREYIRSHEVRFIVDLAEETGVDRGKILKWVEEGKLDMEVEISERPEDGCKRCGQPAGGADLCERCRKEIADQIARQRAGMQAPSPRQLGTDAPASRATPDGMHNSPR